MPGARADEGRGVKGKRTSEDLEQRIRELLLSGVFIAHTAQRLGIRKGPVRRIADELKAQGHSIARAPQGRKSK